jgi:hypothetical protein
MRVVRIAVQGPVEIRRRLLSSGAGWQRLSFRLQRLLVSLRLQLFQRFLDVAGHTQQRLLGWMRRLACSHVRSRRALAAR